MVASTTAELMADLERRLGKARADWDPSDWSAATEELARHLGTALRVLNVAMSNIEQLRAELRVPAVKRFVTLADADPELRVQGAEDELRRLLRNPFGREAYVRLTRSGHDEAEQLLARHKGSMPTRKGDLAMRLLRRDKPVRRRPRGRPRKRDDLEALRWLRQLERLEAMSGRTVPIPRFVAAVFRRESNDPEPTGGERSIKALADRIRAARKRERRLRRE